MINEKILKRLIPITGEERAILNGEKIDKNLYMNGNASVISLSLIHIWSIRNKFCKHERNLGARYILRCAECVVRLERHKII